MVSDIGHTPTIRDGSPEAHVRRAASPKGGDWKGFQGQVFRCSRGYGSAVIGHNIFSSPGPGRGFGEGAAARLEQLDKQLKDLSCMQELRAS